MLAILQEFGDIEYLGTNPADYQLLQADDRKPLDEEQPLSALATHRLILVERDLPLPPGAMRPSQPIYLREQTSGIAYKLHWLPAIVGRCSESLPLNDLVAVDLGVYPTGPRVSRRHVKITEEEGRYYVQSLSNNPVTLVRTGQNARIPLSETRQLLTPGDMIDLERSDLKLKFIVHGETMSDEREE